jgi:hypothetical protein
VLDEECRKRSVDHKYFLDLKVVRSRQHSPCSHCNCGCYSPREGCSQYLSLLLTQEGRDVTLDDGTIVRAADVIGPSIKGRKVRQPIPALNNPDNENQ